MFAAYGDLIARVLVTVFLFAPASAAAAIKSEHFLHSFHREQKYKKRVLKASLTAEKVGFRTYLGQKLQNRGYKLQGL